jgi:hypothetical protein
MVPAVQGLLDTVGQRNASVPAAAFGVVVMFIGATSVFAELQDAFDRACPQVGQRAATTGRSDHSATSN